MSKLHANYHHLPDQKTYRGFTTKRLNRLFTNWFNLEFKDTEEEFCHSSRYVTVENLNASPETRRRMFDSTKPCCVQYGCCDLGKVYVTWEATMRTAASILRIWMANGTFIAKPRNSPVIRGELPKGMWTCTYTWLYYWKADLSRNSSLWSHGGSIVSG